MTPAAEKDIRSALVGVHRLQRRTAMAFAGGLNGLEALELAHVRSAARRCEEGLLALLGAEGKTR